MISHMVKCQNGLKFNAKQKLGLGVKENRRKPRNGKKLERNWQQHLADELTLFRQNSRQ